MPDELGAFTNREPYTLGYGSGAVAMMASRTARSHAGFFLTTLEPGMRVLDIGCGPGTVTVGFAERAHPGEVIGVELDLRQTAKVASRAAREHLNLRFEQADAYDLPYPDASFDAVFMSALIGNLRHPVNALSEAFRVLRNEGVVGVKEFDQRANIIYPELEFQSKVDELHNRLRIRNGHDPDSGRKLKGLLETAGFERITALATFQNLVPPPGTQGAPFIESILREEWGPKFIELGWATQADIDNWISQSEHYSRGVDFFAANAWVEALAYRPSR